MKAQKSILLFTVIFGLFVGSLHAGDLEKIQGSWQLILQEREGVLQEIPVIIITFSGAEFKTYKEGELVESGTITLNEKASPCHYDAVGSGKGGSETYPAVYRLNGHTWQISVTNSAGGPRPQTFSSQTGSGNQILVWRRVGTLVNEAPAP